MIALLKTSADVQRISDELERQNLALHKTPQKNWDHHLLLQIMAQIPETADILDMGSGGGYTLQIMHQKGYSNIHGIDLTVPSTKLKNRVIKLLNPSAFQPCYTISEGDICDTGFPAESYDLITCISVLEHGVDVARFLQESARLLRLGGVMFTTFDYWESFDPDANEEVEIFDLPWTIFNRAAVEQMIETGSNFGLHPASGGEIPPCEETPVHYAGRDYTFMAIALKKGAE